MGGMADRAATGMGARAAWAAAMLLALSGCGSSGGSGMSVADMFLTAGTSPPPAQQAAAADTYCPMVSVMEGGSAIQAYSGGQVGRAEALRSQVALGQIARECNLQPDGSVLVKVGVEGRALQGASGGAHRGQEGLDGSGEPRAANGGGHSGRRHAGLLRDRGGWHRGSFLRRTGLRDRSRSRRIGCGRKAPPPPRLKRSRPNRRVRSLH
jgi:hypothetical protein